MTIDTERLSVERDLLAFRKWASVNGDALMWLFRESKTIVAHRRKTSVKHLFERMRWDSGIRISGYDADIALRNSFAPLVARILVKSVPGMDACISCHKSRFDKLDDEQIPVIANGVLVWGD